MHLSGLDFFLWALGLFEHSILLAILWYRHRAAQFPIFTVLIVLSVVRTIVLYLTHRYGDWEKYFYTYWTFASLDMVLQLAVVYELSSRVLRPLGAWASNVRRSFLTLAGVSVLIASVLTWLAAPPTQTVRMAVVIRGKFLSSCLMSELFVVMIALSVTMGFPWRTHVARISQGFGVYSIFCVLTDCAHAYFGGHRVQTTFTLLSHIRIWLYCACVAYWALSLNRDEPKPQHLPEQLRLELSELQRRTSTMLAGLRGLGGA